MADDSTNACKEEDHKNEQTQSNQSLRTLLGGMKHGSNMASHSVCSQHNLDMPVVIFILAFIEVIRHIHTAQGTVGRVRNIGIAHLNALVATIVVATMGFIGEGIISTRTRIERADGFVAASHRPAIAIEVVRFTPRPSHCVVCCVLCVVL